MNNAKSCASICIQFGLHSLMATLIVGWCTRSRNNDPAFMLHKAFTFDPYHDERCFFMGSMNYLPRELCKNLLASVTRAMQTGYGHV